MGIKVYKLTKTKNVIPEHREPEYTVPKVIDYPQYNMKCSGDNVILRGIVHVVSGFHLHFMFYRGNLDCFSNRVY